MASDEARAVVTTPKRPRDPNQLAKFIVDVATGGRETEKRENATPSVAGSARAGSAKGGRARAAALTPEQRSEIARQAATLRWKKEI